jgi:ribosome production factor 2
MLLDMACYAGPCQLLRIPRHLSVRAMANAQIPRVELQDAGPSLDLAVRRTRAAPADLMREALIQPEMGKKKQKNRDFEEVEGAVGRIYMPAQDLSTLALAKGKGTKRARREAAAEGKQAKAPRADASLAAASRIGSE